MLVVGTKEEAEKQRGAHKRMTEKEVSDIYNTSKEEVNTKTMEDRHRKPN